MAHEQTYKKGDKVWVQIPQEGGMQAQTYMAEVVAVVQQPLLVNRERHLTVRYLNTDDNAFQCIPESWIAESSLPKT